MRSQRTFNNGLEENDMNLTRKDILGVGRDTSLVGLDWLRPNTPYTKDGIEKRIDCVEFEINHKGIDKLERNIHDETEYVMCFVHLEAGTENLDGIYMSIWNEDANMDDAINTNILTDGERKVVIEYALEELRKWRTAINK